MTNAQYIKAVAKMSLRELLAEILKSPEYLTDGYYRPLGDALRKRGY